MDHSESKNSEVGNSETKSSELNKSKSDLSKLRNFRLNQNYLLAITSFLFGVGTLIGGIIIQRKMRKKIIPSMITYIPYILFNTFYIISCVVHIFSSLYGFLKASWFLSLTIFLRLLAIVTGLFSIYLNYSKKDGLIHKIEDVWFQDSYELIVSYYQDYFSCCGWNTTTATCSYTRCYDFINDEIDKIARMIGIASFVINTFQVGLCVDSILTIALQIENNTKKRNNVKNKNKDEKNGKGNDKSKDNNKDKDTGKPKGNKRLKVRHNSSIEELDDISEESTHFNQIDKNKQKNKKKKSDDDTKDNKENDNEQLHNDAIIRFDTQSDISQSNLSINDTSSNTQNTQNTLYEIGYDKNKSKGKNKKETKHKKSKKSEDSEMELELINDSNNNYK